MISLEERRRELQKVRLKETAIHLLILSGTIRRADIEIRYRPSRIMRPMSYQAPKYFIRSMQNKFQI